MSVRICEHIKDDGLRCGSPAYAGRPFCYYHWRRHEYEPLMSRPAFELPALNSFWNIQLALSKVFRLQTRGEVDRRTAITMLSTIRLAMTSLQRHSNATSKRAKKGRQ